MQMLEKGGMSVLTDGVRMPDESNPRGYFEFEKVKSMARDASWLSEAEGRAVKIIAQLLPLLPPGREYAVLFMERDMREIIRSQAKMLESLGAAGFGGRPDVLARVFQAHVDRAKTWFSTRPGIRSLHLLHREVLQDPSAAAERICGFLDLPLDTAAMASAVDPALHRQKTP